MQLTTLSIVSFAIQQLLQLLDPLVSLIPGLHEDQKTAEAANWKKALMGLLAVLCGVIAVQLVDGLRVLTSAGVTNHPNLDILVSSLVVGAGTEASNTVQKILSYGKNKVKGAKEGAD